MATDLKDFESGDRSVVAKHLRRTHWIKCHLPDVLEWLNIDSESSEWNVIPVIILDGVQVIPFLLRSEIPIVLVGEYEGSNFSEFKNLLVERQLAV